MGESSLAWTPPMTWHVRSEDEPQYLVRNGKSDGTAVHKAEALRKVGS